MATYNKRSLQSSSSSSAAKKEIWVGYALDVTAILNGAYYIIQFQTTESEMGHGIQFEDA